MNSPLELNMLSIVAEEPTYIHTLENATSRTVLEMLKPAPTAEPKETSIVD